MSEYIERDKILGYMDLVVIHARGVSGDDPISKKVTDIVAGMRDIVAMAPAADVAPVVHGRWEEWWPPKHMIFTGEEMLWRCSACDAKYSDKENMSYCPRCGARMDGE